MAVTFDIADVELGTKRLECIPVAEAIHRLTSVTRQQMVLTPEGKHDFETVREPFVACEAVVALDGGVFEAGVHPFVLAVQLAFDQHLPLELSPDQVWIVLAQGYAQHVRLHQEQLRHHFVSHQGRESIQIRRDDFVLGRADNPWPEVFDSFAEQLRERIGKRHDLVVADFSTTTPLERAVSQLVLMDAMEGYFSYEFRTACGIPRITLTGTADDWHSIRTRAQVFREVGLEAWIDALTPILDGFVAAAEGRVDRAFWCSMYKYKSASGGPYVTGWLQLLYPYLKRAGHSLVLNPNLASWREGMHTPFGGGPTTEDFPSSLSSVPFVWKYLDDTLPMSFLGGFVGVRQDPTSLTVTPQLGWAVRRRVLDDAAGRG